MSGQGWFGPHWGQRKAERNAAVRRDRLAGLSYRQLARRYGITRQRAEQLCRGVRPAVALPGGGSDWDHWESRAA